MVPAMIIISNVRAVVIMQMISRRDASKGLIHRTKKWKRISAEQFYSQPWLSFFSILQFGKLNLVGLCHTYTRHHLCCHT